MTGRGDRVFGPFVTLWRLTPDGAPVETRSSRLLPVRTESGSTAMLKVAFEAEERAGAAAMEYWAGEGAARVIARSGDALLMERAEGNRQLAEMSRTGRDDEATSILCDVLGSLHLPRSRPAPDLVPLTEWFRDLFPAANSRGGRFAQSAGIARRLLAAEIEVRPLHGDVHHGNVLDFGARGWLAIDPKGLIGDRCFDYANIFCNPDAETAAAPGRFARRVEIVCASAGFDRSRLLEWIMAWTGLSAAWSLQDGEDPSGALAAFDAAAAELAQA